jgi:hypothetical protein
VKIEKVAMAKRKLRKTTTTKPKKARKKAAKRTAARHKPSKAATRLAKKPRKKAAKQERGKASKARSRTKKPLTVGAPQIETEIVDVIDEPVPGVVRVTEFETTRLIVPDAADEDED